MVAKYTWAAVDIPRRTARVKYMCGKHWFISRITQKLQKGFSQNLD